MTGVVDGLRVEVLGPLRAWLGGTEVTLGTARRRATFSVLVGRGDAGASYRELIDAVWGAVAPATAQNNLHTYVSGLRRALGPARDLLATTPDGYRLSTDGVEVDAFAFDQCRAGASRMLLEGRLEAAADELTAALGMWRGEAYSGVPGPFAELEGERLAEAHTAAREQRARVLVELGRAAEVVGDAALLVREHPLRESGWELLVLALHRSGRHAEAQAADDESRRTLRRELDLTADPAPEPPGDAGAHPLPGRTRAPGPVVPAATRRRLAHPPALVGRDDAVRRLRARVAGVLDRTGAAVWVEGDAGLGRSALVHATLAGADALGCAVGWGDADELLEMFELQVLLNCFDIDLVPGGRLAPGHEDDTAENRLTDLITRTCARTPLALVVDDMHWADAATIELWHRLVRMTGELPLLLVATTWPRGERADLGLLRDRIGAAGGEIVDLAPLPPADSAQVVRDHVACSDETAGRLAAEGEGNPMRLVELAGTLGDREPPVPREPQAVETGWRPPVRSSRGAAHRVLLALPLQVADVLRTAAVLGIEFSCADLVLVADHPEDEVRAAVDRALAARALVDRGGVLAFRTDPLWRAAHERIPAPLREPLRRQFDAILAAGPTGARRDPDGGGSGGPQAPV